ncbi:MAG TPA: dsRBD fold-containing protein, partial [Acidimicrobiales bacterium]|nr:dsRBD fold-containing protein [Acidimicrobiales bacterium]
FDEVQDQTDADALLEAGAIRYRARGRARRNPRDPRRPQIGEEVAAARALEGLATQLRRAAEHDIETVEGHPVEIHLRPTR